MIVIVTAAILFSTFNKLDKGAPIIFFATDRNVEKEVDSLL